MSDKRGLKSMVTGGVSWSFAEKIASILLQLSVNLIVIRLLVPNDYGIIAVLAIFSALSLIVVDSGFTQMLIRNTDPTQEEFRSVFAFNITVSILLYIALVLLAPVMAQYYDMPIIAKVAPIFFLQLPINALCSIQGVALVRQFKFKQLSTITFVSSIVSGGVTISMASLGFGVWSLVFQRVSMMLTKAILLWGVGEWRGAIKFNGGVLKRMAPYSMRLMATDMITVLYNKIPQLFFAKVYSGAVLGYYDQAQKLKDMPVTSATLSVQSVIFPALSKIGDDDNKFADSYKSIISVMAYIMFPMMVGAIAVSEDLFALLLGAEWMPIVPYFRVASLMGLFSPIAMIGYNVLKVKSDGKILMRVEVLKKIIMTVIFLITIPHSVIAVLWGLVVMSIIDMVVNLLATTKYTIVKPSQFVMAIIPIALISLVMYFAVDVIDADMIESLWLRVVAKIAMGAFVYIGLSAIFRLNAFGKIIQIIKEVAHR